MRQVAFVLATIAAVQLTGSTQVPASPPTRVVDTADVMHGVSVPDPYRWLEDQDAPDTRAWLSAQMAYTRAIFDARPGRPAVRQLVERLQRNIDRLPFVMAGDGRNVLYSHADAGSPLRSFYTRSRNGGEPQRLLSPPATTDGGSDESEVAFLDIASGRTLRDRFPRLAHSPGMFLPDNVVLLQGCNAHPDVPGACEAADTRS